MVKDFVVLVDDNDQEVGIAEKLYAHQQALQHRAFSIFIFMIKQQKISVLLQQRQHDKYHCGGLWTNACCSHPRPKETVMAAANRRLNEEMGMVLPLEHQGYFIYSAKFDNGLTEKELDHVLVGLYHGETIRINPQEVSAFAWRELQQLMDELSSQPHKYTAWLKPALTIALRHPSILSWMTREKSEI